MAHIHSVYDTDKHFTIDPLTRDLKNMTPGKAGIMQYDHNSERITFELPAVIEGHNTLDCNVVEVHYLNIDAQTKDQNRGLYEVDDLQASPDDSSIAVCSWLISRNATQLVGPLYFRLTFKCVTDVIDYSWSTAVYKALSVSDGINNSDWVAEEYSDILEQWRVDLFNGAGNGGGVTSWNDLTDKPFGDETVYYECNRNAEYAEKAPVYDGTEVAGYMVKLSNDTPTYDFFIGKYAKITTESGTALEQIWEDLLVVGEKLYTVAQMLVVALDTEEIKIGEMSGTLTKGVWCVDLSDSSIESLKIVDPAKPIPENFIPDTIARVSQIPEIPEIPESLVQSVNGIKPDENGNVNVECSSVTAEGTFLNLGYDSANIINRYDNLNDYVTPGVYRYRSPNATVGTSNILNVPDTGINKNTGGFRLIVSELSSSSNADIDSFMQTIVFDTPDYSTLQIWTRVHSKYGSGSGWSPWFKSLTTSDVQAMIDAAGGSGGLSRDEVQTMIDEALGVIENGTY